MPDNTKFFQGRRNTCKPQRRPCNLSFHFPPTPDEARALEHLRKSGLVGDFFSVTKEGDRLVVMTEYYGSEAAPEVLAYKKKASVRHTASMGADLDIEVDEPEPVPNT